MCSIINWTPSAVRWALRWSVDLFPNRKNGTSSRRDLNDHHADGCIRLSTDAALMPLLSMARRVGDAAGPAQPLAISNGKPIPTASSADRIASSWPGETSCPSSKAEMTSGATSAAPASPLGVHFRMSRARRHWSGLTPALDGSGARGVRFPVACKYHPNGADRPHEDVAAMLMDSPREVRCTDTRPCGRILERWHFWDS
jgi:hypothetical protein